MVWAKLVTLVLRAAKRIAQKLLIVAHARPSEVAVVHKLAVFCFVALCPVGTVHEAARDAVGNVEANLALFVKVAARVRGAVALVLVEATASSATPLVIIKGAHVVQRVAALYALLLALVGWRRQARRARHCRGGGRGGRGRRRCARDASVVRKGAPVWRARSRVLERPAREVCYVTFGVAPMQVVVVFVDKDAPACRAGASVDVVLVVAAARLCCRRAVDVVARFKSSVVHAALRRIAVCRIVVKLGISAPPLPAAANLPVQRPVEVAARRYGAFKEAAVWNFGAIDFPPGSRREQSRGSRLRRGHLLDCDCYAEEGLCGPPLHPLHPPAFVTGPGWPGRCIVRIAGSDFSPGTAHAVKHGDEGSGRKQKKALYLFSFCTIKLSCDDGKCRTRVHW